MPVRYARVQLDGASFNGLHAEASTRMREQFEEAKAGGDAEEMQVLLEQLQVRRLFEGRRAGPLGQEPCGLRAHHAVVPGLLEQRQVWRSIFFRGGGGGEVFSGTAGRTAAALLRKLHASRAAGAAAADASTRHDTCAACRRLSRARAQAALQDATRRFRTALVSPRARLYLMASMYEACELYVSPSPACNHAPSSSAA